MLSLPKVNFEVFLDAFSFTLLLLREYIIQSNSGICFVLFFLSRFHRTSHSYVTEISGFCFLVLSVDLAFIGSAVGKSDLAFDHTTSELSCLCPTGKHKNDKLSSLLKETVEQNI